MKRIFWLLGIYLTGCQLSNPNEFKLSADFDESERIYLVFTPNESILELIVTLSKYEKVGVFLENEDRLSFADSVLKAYQANISNIQFDVEPGLDIWIRDNGPAIIKNDAGELRAVDFRSNIMEFEHNDENIARKLNLPLVRARIMSVGGSRESNGEGVVIMTENFFLTKSSKIRKEHIEEELKKNCGIKDVIWLKKGLIEDELFSSGPVFQNIYPVGTGGHIDEFCRFVNPHTVLLAAVEPEDLNKHPLYLENHKRLEENYSILKTFEKQDIKVVRIPTAEFTFQQEIDPTTGKSFDFIYMASYLNFVIGNNVVVAACYYEEGMPLSIKMKDEKVKTILQTQFPDHHIVQINPKHLNARGGGFHCMTYNLPSKKKKRWKMG